MLEAGETGYVAHRESQVRASSFSKAGMIS